MFKPVIERPGDDAYDKNADYSMLGFSEYDEREPGNNKQQPRKQHDRVMNGADQLDRSENAFAYDPSIHLTSGVRESLWQQLSAGGLVEVRAICQRLEGHEQVIHYRREIT